MKRIVLRDRRDRKKIREAFGVTDNTVKNALNFLTPNSLLCEKIRNHALDNGAKLVEFD